jgi:hypothetical protein
MQRRAESWSNELGERQSPVGKEVSAEAEDIVGIRYQATTGEDVVSWEDLACAVVRIKVRKLVRALNLLVAAIYKSSINPITNPVSSH